MTKQHIHHLLMETLKNKDKNKIIAIETRHSTYGVTDESKILENDYGLEIPNRVVPYTNIKNITTY